MSNHPGNCHVHHCTPHAGVKLKLIVSELKRGIALLRILALVGGMLTLGPVALAINASPHPVTLQQPDGTNITLYPKGDEFSNWFEDEKGYSVVLNGKQYCYAIVDASGKLAPTALLVGRTSPAAAGLPVGLKPTAESLRSQRIKALPPALRPAAAASSGLIAEPPTGITPVGTVKNLVVLCKFSDHDNTKIRAQADFDKIFNTVGGDPVLAPTGSVRDYYYETSYGTLTLQSTVVAWVTLPRTEAYYCAGQTGFGNYPTNGQGMVEDALNLVDPLIDFGQFDSDADGFIDAITIIHSGYAAETGGGSGNWMWSHKWSLYSLAGGRWTSQDNNSGGVKVKVYDYHTEAALWGTSGTGILRIGVICHETGHFFGLPDLYDTDQSSEGIGSYCLMANSWGFDGTQQHPPHFSAWCKIKLGWLTPTLINSGNYSAPQVETNKSVFKVTSGYGSSEYLLIENRQPVGFETSMPQGGLAVWHIDESKAGNSDEGYPGQSGWPANNKHYKIALLQADGRYDMEKKVNRGDSGDLYRSGGVSSITPSTVPNTDRYQGGTVSTTNNSITGISTSGSTMTFTLSSGGGGSQPNLTPYTPSGWSDEIVVSKVTGTNTDATPLGPTDTLYVDWAVINSGTANITTDYNIALYVDGTLKTFWTNPPPTNSGSYRSIQDYNLGTLSEGVHTLRIVADSSGVITESNEGDNEYIKTITVGSAAQPNLTPYAPAGWSDKIVVSKVTGTNTDSAPLSVSDTLYVDWAVINSGTANITADFNIQLYVDGALKAYWTNPPPTNTGVHRYVQDYNLGTLSAGTHTLRIVADSSGVIAESNEGDNEFMRTITVGGGIPNDNFSNGLTIAGATGTTTGSNVGATKEVGEPFHYTTGGASVWWKWVAPSSGTVTFDTIGSSFDTMLAGYTGSAVNALTQLAQNDDEAATSTLQSRISFPVTAGTTYSIAVDGYNDGTTVASGNITLHWNLVTGTLPTITSHPANTTILSGQTATLTVEATGAAPLTYQWYQGTSPATTAPVGTNSPSFTTPALSTTTSYWVRVTNSAGSANSNTATVTVTAVTPPSITSNPANTSISSGQTAALSVAATGSAPLTYQWYQGTSPSTTTPVGTNSSSFTTPALTATTSYWVRVSNSAGFDNSSTATVTVTGTGLPMITSHPASTTIPSGQTASLSVVATGTAPLTYQWYQGTSPSTATPVGTNSQNFTTPALTATTNYWVRVTNSAGTANSNTATVTVVFTGGNVAARTLPAGYVAGSPLTVTINVTPATGVASYAVEDTPPPGWVGTNISNSGVWDPANLKVKWGPFFDNTARTLTYQVTPPTGTSGARTFSGIASFDGNGIAITGSSTIDSAQGHPADNASPDWRLVINELTAYGAAWKNGSTWPLPPNPIDVNYVTRAGYLWKNGELYHVDPSVDPSSPLRFVIGAAPGPQTFAGSLASSKSERRAAPATSGVARRQLPTTLLGEAMPVTLDVKPDAATASYAVEDRPPQGWRVTGIDHNGVWDKTSGSVKWGPFLDNQPRSLSYRVKPLARAREAGTFGGKASFDGTSVAVNGAGSKLDRNGERKTFAEIAGSYLGLIKGDSAQNATSGSVKLTVSRSGNFSATVLYGGAKAALRGRFAYDGTFVGVIKPARHPAARIYLYLDVTANTGQLTGYIEDGAKQPGLLAERGASYSRTRPAPQAGRYTLVSSAADLAAATVEVNVSGGVKVKGVLSDGTPFTQISALSASGVWPFYFSFKRGGDCALGFLTVVPENGPSVDGGLIEWSTQLNVTLPDASSF